MNEGKKAAHTNRWKIAEVVFGIPLLISILVHMIFPLSISFFHLFPGIIGLALGVIFIVAGIIIIVLARREFKLHHQPTDPGLSTERLISTGVFRFSRNPLYLGISLIFLSIGFLFSLLWIFILFFPTLAACYFLLIRPEEKYLTEKFGKQYINYMNSVSRWIGKEWHR